MKKVLYCLILMVWGALACAQIKAIVDETQLKLGESVRLVLSTDANLRMIPDITPLNKDFMILSTERTSSFSNINGQTNLSLQWIIQLQPKHEGKLIIPSIRIGQEKTSPIEIQVTADQEETSLIPNEDVMLIASIDKPNPYVNEQVNYTVKLYTRKPLIDVAYQGPELNDGLIIALGDTRNYQTKKNGQIYSVEEQHYVLFPQKSGTLQLKSPQLAATSYDGMAERIKVKANTVSLTVKPIPVFAKNMPWVPATSVQLQQEYEGNLKEVKQGDTLSRKINIEVKGLPGQLLPNLSFAQADGFSVYPESPQIENSVSNDQLVGKSTLRVTYLFNKAGQMIIPAIALQWFNTQNQKVETAILPPLSLMVTPVSAPNTQNISPEPISKPRIDTPEPAQEHARLAWIIAAVFASAWILTLFFWWFKPTCLQHWQKKRCLKALRRACLKNQSVEAKTALLWWAQLTWPEQTVLSLNEIAFLSQSADLKHEINTLLNVLYSVQPIPWQGVRLWQLVSAYKKKNFKKEASSLPPLHLL